MVFDAWVTASLSWPGYLTSDERWAACRRIILQPGRSLRSGTGYTSNAAAIASVWVIRQLCTFYFMVQKDEKQTSLTVWPLNSTKQQFPTFPRNKSLILKDVASSKGEYWPICFKWLIIPRRLYDQTMRHVSLYKSTKLFYAKLSVGEISPSFTM